MIYQCVKIPTTLNVRHFVVAESLEAAREWATANLDTSVRWVIKEGSSLDSRTLGEAFSFEFYTATYSDKPVMNKRSYKPRNTTLFETKAAALADRNKHKAEAERLLDEAEGRLNGLLSELDVTLSCHMEGDTRDIYEDYQYLYLEVKVNGYYFHRNIDR